MTNFNKNYGEQEKDDSKPRVCARVRTQTPSDVHLRKLSPTRLPGKSGCSWREARAFLDGKSAQGPSGCCCGRLTKQMQRHSEEVADLK